jgi:hypothetical protein
MVIERGQWAGYFAELSRQAEGYDTTIEILGPDIGDQVEAAGAALQEVAFDAREGISVAVGGTVRHVVARPARVDVTDETGIPSALRIEDEDGTETLVRLSPPEAGR